MYILLDFMEEIPESSNQGIPVHVDPRCFGNVGPPMMATLSLPRLTIGLPVWLFSIPSVPNVPTASSVSSPCQRHHNNTDPLLSRPVKSFPPSSSSSVKVWLLVTRNQRRRRIKVRNQNNRSTPQSLVIMLGGNH